jgi:SAM-dependent methyltransferase
VIGHVSPAGSNANDPSQGYDAVAGGYTSQRSPTIGIACVERWAKSLPTGAEVLELGCGTGVPISRVLSGLGLRLYALDASPRMVAEFRRNLPNVLVACEAAERSAFFSHRFDAAIAWGLLFLLDPPTQAMIIRKVADALRPGGSFLFTAPAEAVEWNDVMTGVRSVSLGGDRYRELLASAQLTLLAEYDDEGRNHYFEARKGAQAQT